MTDGHILYKGKKYVLNYNEWGMFFLPYDWTD